jgi:hypothetical protein
MRSNDVIEIEIVTFRCNVWRISGMRQRTRNYSVILPRLSLKIGGVTCVVLRVLAFSSIVCGEMATSEASRASINGRTSSRGP